MCTWNWHIYIPIWQKTIITVEGIYCKYSENYNSRFLQPFMKLFLPLQQIFSLAVCYKVYEMI